MTVERARPLAGRKLTIADLAKPKGPCIPLPLPEPPPPPLAAPMAPVQAGPPNRQQRRRQWIEPEDCTRRQHNLLRFRVTFPAVSDIDAPKALAIGTGKILVELGWHPDEVDELLAWWCVRPPYKVAVATGQRYRLDGTHVVDLACS